MIFLAAFIKDTPSTALWHVLDRWEGVEVRDIAVVSSHDAGFRCDNAVQRKFGCKKALKTVVWEEGEV